MSETSFKITFDGSEIAIDPSKTLLDNLLDKGIDATFSCKKGTCFSCVVQTNQHAPINSQGGLKPTLVEQGYFLACQAQLVPDMVINSANKDKLFQKARVDHINLLSGNTIQIFLHPLSDFNYRAGQFLNILSVSGEVRSYSIASATKTTNGLLELHVKIHEFGKVSGWLGHNLSVGDEVSISGANGECFYLAAQPDRPLLLIGTGTGLAPLLGIARDALAQNHTGPITLYHGAVDGNGLYLNDELAKLSEQHDNFEVNYCVLKNRDGEEYPEGAIHDLALAGRKDLKNYCIYICGDPTTVKKAKQMAYLSGANLADIFSDPFETKVSAS